LADSRATSAPTPPPAGLPITICGEAAGRPVEALALMSLGYRRLSMQASRIAPIKRMIRSVSLAELAPRVQAAIEDDGPTIRDKILMVAGELAVKM
jgi:phosphotransferase system enzyme I (PtsP)